MKPDLTLISANITDKEKWLKTQVVDPYDYNYVIAWSQKIQTQKESNVEF